MTKEAMKQMVEALNDAHLDAGMPRPLVNKYLAALEAGRKAVAEAEKQEQCSDSEQLGEPVAWMQDSIELYVQDHPNQYYTIPLYTTPQQRKPLTDEQIGDIAALFYPRWQGHEGFARAIEAAHGIKE